MILQTLEALAGAEWFSGKKDATSTHACGFICQDYRTPEYHKNLSRI